MLVYVKKACTETYNYVEERRKWFNRGRRLPFLSTIAQILANVGQLFIGKVV